MRAHLDTSTFLSSHGVTIEDVDSHTDVLMTKDDPEHTWHRELVSPVFTPRAIADLESAGAPCRQRGVGGRPGARGLGGGL
jgi:cytochrome P450